jgi:hypothetical protein
MSVTTPDQNDDWLARFQAENDLKYVVPSKGADRPFPPPLSPSQMVSVILNSHFHLLRQHLNAEGKMIVPTEATNAMVAASMATVTRHVGNMTKKEKHTRRINAALAAHALKSKQIKI